MFPRTFISGTPLQSVKMNSSSSSSSDSSSSSSDSESHDDMDTEQPVHTKLKEHVDEETINDDAGKKGEHSNRSKSVWGKASTLKLISEVLKQTASDDVTPFDHVEIDWDTVNCGIDATKCKARWTFLTSQVRHYRTLTEVGLDVLTMNKDPQISHWNKSDKHTRSFTTQTLKVQDKEIKNETKTESTGKRVIKRKKKPNPNHPARPVSSGYQIFANENLKKYKGVVVSEPVDGVNINVMVESMKKVGQEWKALAENKRKVYMDKWRAELEDYQKRLEDYAKLHPEDKEMQNMIKNLSRRRRIANGVGNSTVNSPSISKFFTKNKHLDDEEEDETVLDTSAFETTPVKKTPKKKRKISHLEEEVEAELNTTMDSSPSKKSHKSPKKKKARKEWSAAMVFTEMKWEEYKETHPDMDKEDIETRLAAKFNKLKESKQAKYNQLAEEKNQSR